MKYDTRLIAFVDILGFKEIIKQSEKNPAKIELIYSVLDYLKVWEAPKSWNLKVVEIEGDAQKKGVENFDISNKTNCTTFSDSIVISVKIDNNVNEMASTLIANLAYIGAILIEQGILIRGAITIGEIIHENNGTVFGQGLIDSYLLESSYSKYPRIILSDKLIAKLNYPFGYKKDRYPYHQYLDRFFDGCVGFHQMIYYEVVENSDVMTKDELVRGLTKIRKVIIEGLDMSFENPEVFEKYKWMKEQYNKLIISDYDYNTKERVLVKVKIKELNEGIFGHNIHFKYTDEEWERMGLNEEEWERRENKRNENNKI